MFPPSAAEDAGRLTVAVLSGFLGSGKTTLLNRLLQDTRLAAEIAARWQADLPRLTEGVPA